MPPGRKGATAEASIAAHAIQLGVFVLRPVLDGLRYDLIFDTGQRLLRVQCKWGRHAGDVVAVRLRTCRHTPTNGYVRTTYAPDEVDAIAVYCAQLRRCFLVPINEVAGRSDLHLRLTPARNNQQFGVRMASDYDLAKMLVDQGAIAQLGERVTGSHEVAGSSPASST